MLVAALIATAALAHAVWNVAVKRAGTSGPGFLWSGLTLGALVFAPFGIMSLATADLGLRWMPWALGSGILQVGYLLLLQRGYRLGDVSIVYPLARGTGPLVSVLLAIVILGERPGWLTLVGAAIVIVGVLVIGFAGARSSFRLNRAGILYGLAVGVFIGCYTLWDAAAVTVGGMPPIGVYWASIVVQLAILALPALRQWSETWRTAREHWVAVLLFGILSPLAYVLILFAIQHAPLVVVAPAREVSVVLVGLAGLLLFKEPHPVQRLLGAAILLTGVAVLALA
jgi:drug/metabolite transporter (DMT)-like permease